VKDAIMRRRWPFNFAVVALFVCLDGASGAPVDTTKVLDSFTTAVQKIPTATVDQKRVVGELIKQLRQSSEDRAAAITESLRLLYPDFKAALTALGEDNLGAAIVGLSELRESA